MGALLCFGHTISPYFVNLAASRKTDSIDVVTLKDGDWVFLGRGISRRICTSRPAKIGDYYTAWMDESAMEKLAASPIEPYLEQINRIVSKK
jgi:hypothetical protein